MHRWKSPKKLVCRVDAPVESPKILIRRVAAPVESLKILIRRVFPPVEKGLERLGRIEGVPPLGLPFQPFREPGEDGVGPEDPLVVVEDMVVLVGHLDERGRLAQQFQRREHLDALAHGHVRVGRAVQEEERRVDLVGVEERALQRIEVAGVPRVAVGRRQGAVGITPVALAPIAGDVADAGVRDGRREDVRLRLEVLRHEAAIRGADATDLVAVDEGMLLAETLGALDDLVGRHLTPGVHVARGEFLPEAGRPAGLQDIDDVAQRGVGVGRVAALERALRRRGTAVVVHDERVFLARVEMGRQVETAVDGIALGRDEVPVLHLAQRHVLQDLLREVDEPLALQGLEIEGIEPLRVGDAHAVVGQARGVAGERDVLHHILVGRQLADVAIRRVEAVEAHVVAVLGREIDLVIICAPGDAADGWIECLGKRLRLFRGDIEQEELPVGQVGGLSLLDVEADTTECLARAMDEQLLAVGREEGVVHELVAADERIDPHARQVEAIDAGGVERPFGQAILRAAEKQLAAISRDVVQPGRGVAEGQPLAKAVGKVVFIKEYTVAPARLTIVGHEDLPDLLVLFRPFFLDGEDEVILGRGEGQPSVGQFLRQDRLRLADGIDNDQPFALRALLGVIGLIALGEPLQILAVIEQGLARLAVDHLRSAHLLTAREGLGRVDDQVFPARREADAGEVLAIQHVVDEITLLRVGGSGDLGVAFRLEGTLDLLLLARAREVFDDHLVAVRLEGEGDLAVGRFHLLAIDVDSGDLRPLHRERAFYVAVAVEVERDEVQGEGAIVARQGQLARRAGIEGFPAQGDLPEWDGGVQQFPVGEFLAFHVGLVHLVRGGDGIRAGVSVLLDDDLLSLHGSGRRAESGNRQDLFAIHFLYHV